LGFEGDFYLDTLTNNYYVKNEFCEWELKGNLNGTVGEQGEAGEQGEPGEDGREIELQVSEETDFLQWRYVGEPTWTNLVSLASLQGPEGPEGPQGCSLLQGTGVPDPGLGKDCDSYLDTDTKDLYLKSMGAWVLTTNLTVVTETLAGPEGLFSAESTIDIVGTSNPFQFPNDSVNGRYDYGNHFFTDTWVAPFDIASVSFTLFAIVEFASIGESFDRVVLTIYKNGVFAAGDDFNADDVILGEIRNYTYSAPIPVLEGDLITFSIEAEKGGGSSGAVGTIKTGSSAHNLIN
jgi:hypothetical protein